MMSLFAFLLEATVISMSGVLSPGPVTAVAVGKGSESPHAGAWVAVGHGLVEIPLMAAIFFGLGYVLNQDLARAAVALVGGLFLLVMGLGMLRGVKQVEVSSSKSTRSPVIAGVLLSLGNPYFLIWWATVGAALIMRSASFGPLGFLLFALAHWLCDFFWAYFLSALSFKGGRFFGRRFQEVVFAASGLFLLFFSGRFIVDAVKVLLA